MNGIATLVVAGLLGFLGPCSIESPATDALIEVVTEAIEGFGAGGDS